jgi:hypothetical protein
MIQCNMAEIRQEITSKLYDKCKLLFFSSIYIYIVKHFLAINSDRHIALLGQISEEKMHQLVDGTLRILLKCDKSLNYFLENIALCSQSQKRRSK